MPRHPDRTWKIARCALRFAQANAVWTWIITIMTTTIHTITRTTIRMTMPTIIPMLTITTMITCMQNILMPNIRTALNPRASQRADHAPL